MTKRKKPIPDSQIPDSLTELISRQFAQQLTQQVAQQVAQILTAGGGLQQKAPPQKAAKPNEEALRRKSKKCPHCGQTKNVGEGFGVRYSRGIPGPHSWCRTCRSSTNYRQLPRKYNVRHVSERQRP